MQRILPGPALQRAGGGATGDGEGDAGEKGSEGRVGVSQLPRSQVGPTHPSCIQGHLLWGLKFLLWEEAVPGLCEEGLVGFWVPQLSQPDWLKQQSEETNDPAYPGWLHPRWLTEVTPTEQGPVVWWV